MFPEAEPIPEATADPPGVASDPRKVACWGFFFGLAPCGAMTGGGAAGMTGVGGAAGASKLIADTHLREC